MLLSHGEKFTMNDFVPSKRVKEEIMSKKRSTCNPVLYIKS